MVSRFDVCEDVYLIGGQEISALEDCCVYLLNVGELVLIDTGAGRSYPLLVRNIEEIGLNPELISAVILTHCHIDHVGGTRSFREGYNCKVIAHGLDAATLENGDPDLTGASLYNINFSPVPVDIKLTQAKEILNFANQEVVCLHTPGHTPGSISIYMDRCGKRVLFGQDIHGPFLKGMGSDLEQWRDSMELLLSLDADILCEGHFGVYSPKDGVKEYIEGYLKYYGFEGEG
ncbi:MAG: MBL fold metallo-hydrolase [Pseudomonadota bacterium]